MNETLGVSGLTFEVRRSSRRKTLGLTVDRHGELLVHAPEGEPTMRIETWVRSKLLWVHRRLATKEWLASALREPEFVSGESFSILGRQYQLRIDPAQEEPLRFDGRKFCLSTQAMPSAARHFRTWFIGSGRVWVRERVALLSRKVGCRPVRVDVRDLGYRWGSCGRNGVLYVNWRTIQLPMRLVDYVLVHELSHLIEPTHGPKFWKVVDRAMPDWRDRREELNRKAQVSPYCDALNGGLGIDLSTHFVVNCCPPRQESSRLDSACPSARCAPILSFPDLLSVASQFRDATHNDGVAFVSM